MKIFTLSAENAYAICWLLPQGLILLLECIIWYQCMHVWRRSTIWNINVLFLTGSQQSRYIGTVLECERWKCCAHFMKSGVLTNPACTPTKPPENFLEIMLVPLSIQSKKKRERKKKSKFTTSLQMSRSPTQSSVSGRRDQTLVHTDHADDCRDAYWYLT